MMNTDVIWFFALLPFTHGLVLPSVLLAALPQSLEDPLGLVEDVARTIEREYVDPALGSSAAWRLAKTEARQEALEDGRLAARKLLTATGDAFTRLVDASEARSFVETFTDRRGSLGLEVTREGLVLRVDDPAKGAGVQTGDVLRTLDGADFEPSKLNDDAGTTVDLGIMRNQKPLKVRVTRTKAPPLVSAVRVGDVVTLTVRPFATQTADAIAEAVAGTDDLLVMDLRGNGGGNVDSGIDAAKLFLPRGAPVATVRSRANDKIRLESRVADAVGPLSKRRLVILVDKGTASAAELFAAALKENGRAVIVGCCSERTYGKARIQRAVPLPGGDLLLVTRAVYETPILHRDLSTTQGLTPDLRIDDPACCRGEERRPPTQCVPALLLEKKLIPI